LRLHAVAALISVILFLTAFMTVFGGAVQANFTVPPEELPTLIIDVTSPQNNKIYNTKTLSLTFTLETPSSFDMGGPYLLAPKVSLLEYRLDSQPIKQITVDDISGAVSTQLTGLTDQEHQITITATVSWVFSSGPVYGEIYGEKHATFTTFFTVDTTPPQVFGCSLQNNQDDTTDMFLEFTVSEPVSWIGYSIDENAIVPITDNTTLTASSYGRYDCVANLASLPRARTP
jgi:hypothetical protein